MCFGERSSLDDMTNWMNLYTKYSITKPNSRLDFLGKGQFTLDFYVYDYDWICGSVNLFGVFVELY